MAFTALANQVYSINLGGNDGSGVFGPHDDYVLGIEASPVSIPAAMWLFGSRLLGMLGLGRRKAISV